MVTRLLSNAILRVRLENDHEVIARAAGRMCRVRSRVLAGDKVRVEMASCDPSKGRIAHRYE